MNLFAPVKEITECNILYKHNLVPGHSSKNYDQLNMPKHK